MELPATTVILPTTNRSSEIDRLAAQLGSEDTLLVVCDTPSDPVAAASLPEQTELVVAGEPTGCSGKANAIAAGMEAATTDRVIWTDDDFEHPPEWIANLQQSYETQGPTTEVPFFRGSDPLSVLCEPIYALGATTGLTLLRKPWGGGVIFERGDLDETAFLAELRETVSDDGLLSWYLDVTPVSRVRVVDNNSGLQASLERNVRFMQIAWRFAPHSWLLAVLSIISIVICLIAPLPAMVGATGVLAGIYRYFGIGRWTAVLAYPALLAAGPLLLYGLTRRSFVWGGRRYYWKETFSVRVSTAP